MAARWSERSYRHNELIVAHGDSGRDVFFLLEGRARVTLFSEDGKEIAYRDVEPGEIFGELAGIDGKARSASVIALAGARVSRLPGTAFRDIVNEPSGLRLDAARAFVGPAAAHDRPGF